MMIDVEGTNLLTIFKEGMFNDRLGRICQPRRPFSFPSEGFGLGRGRYESACNGARDGFLWRCTLKPGDIIG